MPPTRITAAEHDLLASVAEKAVSSEAFPRILLPGQWTTDGENPPEFVPDRSAEATRRASSLAFVILLAAVERGMGLVDALNRAEVTEKGIDFPGGASSTFDDALAGSIAADQKGAGKAAAAPPPPSQAKTHDTAEEIEYQRALVAKFVMPKGFPKEGQKLAECAVGDLAYFLEESRVKHTTGIDAERMAAWKIIERKLPTADALALGKLVRWIVADKPRRAFFNDLLVIGERRMEELAGAS